MPPRSFPDVGDAPRQIGPAGRRALLAGLAGLVLAAGVRAAGARAADRPAEAAAAARRIADALEAELLRAEATLATAGAALDPTSPARPAGAALPLLDRLVRGAAYSLGRPVVALDSRLAPLVDSDLPFGVPLPASGLAQVAADALAGRATAVGLAEGGRLALAVPAPPGAPRPTAVLVTALAAPQLAALLDAALAREGSVAGARLMLLDPSGTPGTTAAAAGAQGAEAALGPATLRRHPGLGILVAEAPLPRPIQAAALPWLAALGGGAVFGGLGAWWLARRRVGRGAADAVRALEELRAICDTIPVGLALLDRQMRLLSANRRIAVFAGLPVDMLAGRPVPDVLPAALAEAIEAAHGQVLRDGRPVLDLSVSVEAAGALRQTRHLLVSCHPVSEGAARIEAVSATVLDVTERTRAEAGRDLLVRELNHRVKNTLVSVLTIAQQTLRQAGPGGEAAEFGRSFTDRIRALARAHDVLTDRAWGDSDLASVISAALAPWLADPRLVVEVGPPAVLRPAQVQALVLAFHELATNAAKYGALTAEGGSVRLGWALAGDGRIRLHWQERGGPPVPAQPVRQGFGTRLLERVLRQDLGADSVPELVFDPAGLRVTIAFRPGALAAPAASATAAPPAEPARLEN